MYYRNLGLGSVFSWKSWIRIRSALSIAVYYAQFFKYRFEKGELLEHILLFYAFCVRLSHIICCVHVTSSYCIQEVAQ